MKVGILRNYDLFLKKLDCNICRPGKRQVDIFYNMPLGKFKLDKLIPSKRFN